MRINQIEIIFRIQKEASSENIHFPIMINIFMFISFYILNNFFAIFLRETKELSSLFRYLKLGTSKRT